jgi:monoamine oxidase
LHADPAERELARLGARIIRGKHVLAIKTASMTPGPITVRLEDGTLTGDAVIVAAPHHDAARMLPAEAGIDAASLDALGSSAIVNLHIMLDRPVMSVPFVAGVDTPLQWVFDRTASSGLGRGQMLAVSLSAADDMLALSTEALRERFVPELSRLFPAARDAEVCDFFVTREPSATFRQAPGMGRHRPGTRTRRCGLYLAGAWTDTGWPATMEGAVRSGLAAAAAAVEDLGAQAGRAPVRAAAVAA